MAEYNFLYSAISAKKSELWLSIKVMQCAGNSGKYAGGVLATLQKQRRLLEHI